MTRADDARARELEFIAETLRAAKMSDKVGTRAALIQK
jgi:hypothetical protein